MKIHLKTAVTSLFFIFSAWSNMLQAQLEPKHTQANFKDFHVTHTHLNFKVDFDNHKILGVATLQIRRLNKSQYFWLDSEKLIIKNITGNMLSFEHIQADKSSSLTEAIKIEMDPKITVSTIEISYETIPDAPGLVWLSADQTTSGQPMVFAMNQPIGARSWFPCQDTPSVRGTFSADFELKADKRINQEALMALISGKNNPKEANKDMRYTGLISVEPIPSYLFVFAAGRFIYKAHNDELGYYADNEKTLLDAYAGFSHSVPAYFEFLKGKLGDNPWQKQDFLLLPPMFGYGGMENPQLIYVNAALVEETGASGYVMAHELAHMWTGNVVTNRKWNGFWLNEAWTTYWELRALKHVHGKNFAQGAVFENYEELIAHNQERINNPNDPVKAKQTILHKKGLGAHHPENLMDFSVYPKGSLMLSTMERLIGTQNFDKYALEYINHFRFKPIDSNAFIDFSINYLTNLKLSKDDWKIFFFKWLYEAGEYPIFNNKLLDNIKIPSGKYSAEKVNKFMLNPKEIDFSDWNRFDVVTLIRSLKASNQSKNLIQLLKTNDKFIEKIRPLIDVQSQWYQTLIEADLWEDQKVELKKFLSLVGRGRIIRPIYLSLKNNGHGDFAKENYELNINRYFKAVSSNIGSLFAQ